MAFTPTWPAAQSSSVDRFIKFVEISSLFSQVSSLSCDNSPPKAANSHLSTSLGGSEDVGARRAGLWTQREPSLPAFPVRQIKT